MAKKKNLEDYFDKLDGIVDELQNGELTLEESFQRYEEGMKLIRECHQSIDQVEKKLQVIQEGMSDAEDI